MRKFTSIKNGLMLAMLFLAGQVWAQTELLPNGGFEEWNGNVPTGWKSASTAGNATLAQSEEARSGEYSVQVGGNEKSNKRLATAEMTLKAGTYTFSAFVMAATEEGGSVALGYVPVTDGKVGSYMYQTENGKPMYYNGLTTSEWTTASYTFTLEEQTTLCLVVMNSKNPGKDVLVDDASLTTEDGGLVGGGDEPTDPDEPENPTSPAFLDAPFSTGQDGFTIDNKVLPAELEAVWSFDAKYGMKATGYAGATKTSYATESWLVSPVVDLGQATKAVLTFDHAGNFFADITTDCSVWVSETGAGNWVQLTVPNYPSNWTFVASGDIDLSAYAGKKIQVAFKYISSDEKAGTWEVKNVLIKGEGGTTTEPDEPEQPGDTTGEGSEENPYTVADVLLLNNPAGAPKAWVKGYIVGYVNGMSYPKNVLFEVSDSIKSNLVLAPSADVTDASLCIPVALPAGTVRDALNLNENPEVLGKEVTLYGSLEKYFGTAGLKSVTKYVLEGTEEPEDTTKELRMYAKATTVESGAKYLIAAPVDGVYKVALPISGNYGYLQVEETEADAAGDLVQKTAANEFEVTAVEGGYTLKASDGRYLYMSGTFNSFNVTAEPTEGHIWTIEADADGAFRITNVEKNKYMQYSGKFSSFGVYADEQENSVLPCLFAYSRNVATAIENVPVSDTNAPVEVYTLGGQKVGSSLNGLKRGIYIVKQGATVRKVLK